MKNVQRISQLVITILLVFALNTGKSQIGCTNFNNTICNVNDYVGWASTESIPLRVKTNAAYPIEFYTNGTQYMTLLGSINPGYLGIGTATPTAIIGLGGNTARTIQMERHTTSNTAGNDLTVLAGGATSGATNKGGGDLYLYFFHVRVSLLRKTKQRRTLTLRTCL